MSLLAVDWGPVGVWAGAIATFLAALIALREFVNVLYLREGSRWRIVTFDDADFIPGFTTELAADRHHVLRLAVFADNAETVTDRSPSRWARTRDRSPPASSMATDERNGRLG